VEELVMVKAPTCVSCETEWIEKSKVTEGAERIRLDKVRGEDLTGYINEVWEYGMRMNDTQRQELALNPDTELRNFIISSSTAPTPLLEHVYNSTMQRVPYEQACYICGPEQAMLLRTLVGLSQPRQCLDVGCFSGYTSAAILEALPKSASLTSIDIEPEWTALASDLLQGRNVEFMTRDAGECMAELEAAGRRFDFVSLDADKVNHADYVNSTLRLLRPGGMLVMFGMLLFLTVEDQQAMEALHESLPNQTRISTAQLPVGCGIQMIVKQEGTSASAPVRFYPEVKADGTGAGTAPLEGEAALLEQRRWQLESELAAIDRELDAAGSELGGAAAVGPGVQPLTSSGLVALAAVRREAEEAMAAAEAEAEAEAGGAQ